MKTTKMFKSALQSLNLFVMIFSFTACTDKQLEFSGSGSSISGSIAGFSAFSSKPSQSVSAFACTSPQAEIYSLDSNGVRSSSALATTAVATNGTFTFKNITSLGIDVQSTKVKYLIAISGCSDPLSRPLTDKKNQEISWGSTIVEKVSLVEYTGKKTLSEAGKTEIISLITKLDQISGASLDAIFTNILSDPTVSSGFQTIFQFPATELQYSKPTVNTVVAPASVNELSTAAFSASASHWHPSYTVAYIWKKNGVQVSNTANYSFTPNANQQGTHTVDLFIGKSDGMGGIDLTKSFYSKSISLTVANSSPAIVPNLSLTSATPTTVAGVSYEIDTGTLGNTDNCVNFSSLLLTVDTAIAPTSSTDASVKQVINCTANDSQAMTYTLAAGDGLRTLRFWAIDSSGNISLLSNSISVVLDQSPPTLSSMSLAGGASVTNNNFVQLNFAAVSTVSSITHYCLKHNDSTAPGAADSCWSVLPIGLQSTNVAITNAQNIFYTLGFSPIIYNTRIWLKDTLGNISTNSATAGTDFQAITFNPGTSPSIINLHVTNVDNPVNPSGGPETVFTLGGDVIIKWKAQDSEGLASQPIALYYTTNASTYTLISSNLNDGVNGACTISAAYSGCYKWSGGAPTTSYFAIKAVVKDSSGNSAITASVPLNQSNLRILAGSLTSGLGGSAKSALLFSGYANNPSLTDKYSLVVSDDGKFFFHDSIRNKLLWIDPADGLLKEFIATTGVSTGDGGLVSSASLIRADAIQLDHQNNLLIWDYNKIRRVNLQNLSITTIIGGGATNNPGSVVNWNQISLDPISGAYISTFFSLPNGDIYFQSQLNTNRYRIYKAATQTIELINAVGPGRYLDGTAAWPSYTHGIGVVYNPANSQVSDMLINVVIPVTGNALEYPARLDIANGSSTTDYVAKAPFDVYSGYYNWFYTALDGKLYTITGYSAHKIRRWDAAANTWTTLLGVHDNGGGYSPTFCSDGTAAVSCNVTLESIFIDKQNKVYFVDHGMIRTIDQSGNVLTLFGQYKSSGDGGLATSAKFGKITSIDWGKTTPTQDKIIAFDDISLDYREIQIDGNVSVIRNKGTAISSNFATDPATGDIFDSDGWTAIYRYVRATSTLTSVVGGGAFPYHDYANSDGKLGNQISFDWYIPNIMAFENDKLVMAKYRFNGVQASHAQVKVYDAAAGYMQSTLAGSTLFLGGTALQADGTVALGVDTILPSGFLNALWDVATSSWITPTHGYARIPRINPGGTIETKVNAISGVYSGIARKKDGSNDKIFYCNSTGGITQYDLLSSTETNISLGVPGMVCPSMTGRILYHPTRNSIIFVYSNDQTYGIAEYALPP